MRADEVNKEIEEIQERKSPRSQPILNQRFIIPALIFLLVLFWVYNTNTIPKQQVFIMGAIGAFLLFMASNKPKPTLITEEQAKLMAVMACKRYYQVHYNIVPKTINPLNQCALRRTIVTQEGEEAKPMYWEIPLEIIIADSTSRRRELYLYHMDPWSGHVQRIVKKLSGYLGSERRDKEIIREPYIIGF